MYPIIKNVALNDMHIYDSKTNAWCAVAIYGDVPRSRWGHKLATNDDQKIMLFGGMNLNSYCESVFYEINIEKLNAPQPIIILNNSQSP